ncbi:MAG: hypothetical protein HY453_02205 [Parcubacteria group bacterium]|nr:hypothetical protein [Parcubacteria group bacterium]
MKKQSVIVISTIMLATFLVSPALAAVPDGLQNDLSELRKEREALKEAKKKVLDESDVEKRAKTKEEKEEAKKKQEENKKRKEEKRKEVLQKVVNTQIRWFSNVKERVSGMPNVSEELKTQLITEIDTDIQKLNEFKTKIEAATAEEMIALGKEVKEFFKTKKDVVQKIVAAIHADLAEKAVLKAEERLKSMQEKVAALKADGKDVSSLENMLSEAEKKIAEAKAAIAKKEIREALGKIKEAYRLFKDIAPKSEEF